jgi:hypothetical protein
MRRIQVPPDLMTSRIMHMYFSILEGIVGIGFVAVLDENSNASIRAIV